MKLNEQFNPVEQAVAIDNTFAQFKGSHVTPLLRNKLYLELTRQFDHIALSRGVDTREFDNFKSDVHFLLSETIKHMDDGTVLHFPLHRRKRVALSVEELEATRQAARSPNSIKFLFKRWFWVTDYGWESGVSLGVHFAQQGRIDFHLLKWMFSFGNVPIYRISGKELAASNSYHDFKTNPRSVGKPPHFRAGTPAP